MQYQVVYSWKQEISLVLPLKASGLMFNHWIIGACNTNAKEGTSFLYKPFRGWRFMFNHKEVRDKPLYLQEVYQQAEGKEWLSFAQVL